MRTAVMQWCAMAVVLLVGVPLPNVVDAVRLIVDVGGHPDDYLALAFLFKHPVAAVQLITVHSTTGADTAAVVSNIERLVAVSGRAGDITVVPGALVPWTDLPERRSANASDPIASTGVTPTRRTTEQLPTRRAATMVPVDVPPTGAYTAYAAASLFGAADVLPSRMAAVDAGTSGGSSAAGSGALLAAAETIKALKETRQPLEYIAFGSLTNLAESLRTAPDSALRNLRRVHILGGSLGAAGDVSHWTGPTLPSDAASSFLPPGFDPATSTATWGMFVDPVAADFVLQFPPLADVRYVYPREAHQDFRTSFHSSTFQTLSTGAFERADALRTQAGAATQQSLLDAELLDFLGALAIAQKNYLDVVAGEPGSGLDRAWFTPAPTFVAIAVAQPATALLGVPPSLQASVDRETGVLRVAEPGQSEVAGNQSRVFQHGPGAATPMWDVIFATLDLSTA